MEMRVIKRQDPLVASAVGERRRSIRHKLNTPAYASFSRPTTGLALDLSELVDISEDGFAVQTNENLELNHSVNFSLDLAETKAYLQCSGRVVWSDGRGRHGIRFSSLSPHSRKQLKEWIFVNLLVAATRHAARKKQTSPPGLKAFAGRETVAEHSVLSSVPDLSGMLSAVEAVRREVQGATDPDAALHLIVERALSLTGASGAALALATGNEMTCRARAGEPAPPLGTVVDVKQGLSGECVRSGRMVVCEDIETDARVDREICHEMGIGSILAAPVVSDFRVVGLLEVFSPYPRAFAEVHETAVDRLAEIVPKAQSESLKASASIDVVEQKQPDSGVDDSAAKIWESDLVAQEPLKGIPVRYFHILLLLLTAGMVALVAGYLLAPTIQRVWFDKPGSPPGTVEAARAAQPAAAPVKPRTVAELRALAERGDAESQWNLGTRYRNGEGVLQDDAQAVLWFLRAAEQGHLNAQSAVAASYWAGRGTPKDLSKAYFWSVIAANQGDDTSESRLQGLALQMTRGEVAAAQAQADVWLRQHNAK